MTTYQKATKEVTDIAASVLCEFESHKPLLDNRVRIDYIMASGERDDAGVVKVHAIVKAGVRCLGVARILGPKDRAMGRGDAEIMIDKDFWDDATEEQQRALLDHEQHHLSIKTAKLGGPCLRDADDRPRLKMRNHDFDFGWFRIIAARHGAASQEQIQAKGLMMEGGQYFWPDLFQGGSVTPAVAVPNRVLAHPDH